MRERFAVAVSAALASADVTASEVADQLHVSYDTVRRWAREGMAPDPLTVFGLEVLLDLPPGELSRHLGYRPVDSGVSVVDAIEADPRLDDTGRAMLLGAYRGIPKKPRRD